MHFFWLTYVFHVPFTCSICRYVEAKAMGFKQRCQESAGILAVGARVRLMGLSQAHFNGLEGYVTGAGEVMMGHTMSHITAIVCDVCVAMVPNMVTGGPFFEYWENQLITFNVGY